MNLSAIRPVVERPEDIKHKLRAYGWLVPPRNDFELSCEYEATAKTVDLVKKLGVAKLQTAE